ncbi:hypothetical protein F4825DRAFT_440238 [Nemania diffusa]|nr:hypothetical protein F4825DRAFT_440238 [Nemania diffusa]
MPLRHPWYGVLLSPFATSSANSVKHPRLNTYLPKLPWVPTYICNLPRYLPIWHRSSSHLSFTLSPASLVARLLLQHLHW